MYLFAFLLKPELFIKDEPVDKRPLKNKTIEELITSYNNSLNQQSIEQEIALRLYECGDELELQKLWKIYKTLN